MKQTFIILLIFGILSCNTAVKKDQQADSNVNDSAALPIRQIENSDFKKYIKSLDQIPLPLKHSSIGELPNLSVNYDKKGFEKYRYVWTSQPLGLLYHTDKNIVTVDLSVGDMGLVPFIMSYDLEGNKIDSLRPYRKTGWDMGYEAVEYVTIKEDLTIIVADSVKTWKLNEDETNIIMDSVTLTVDTVIYRLSDIGKFERE
jgi:hypothetical protein